VIEHASPHPAETWLVEVVASQTPTLFDFLTIFVQLLPDENRERDKAAEKEKMAAALEVIKQSVVVQL
jgi:hypothetical protein